MKNFRGDTVYAKFSDPLGLTFAPQCARVKRMTILKTGLMPSKKKGKVIPNGVSLQAHEFKTVVYFTERGFDVELIPTSHTPRDKKPDIFMAGVNWEMKAPEGTGRMTIEHNLRKAMHQSENIIMDLRRYKKEKVNEAIKLLKKNFKLSRKIRRLCIITQDDELIYLTRRS